MKHNLYVTSVLLVIGLLCGCVSTNQPTDSTGNSSHTDKITSDSTNSVINSNNNAAIPNTSKLKFDDAIINIPDLTNVKSVEFERCNWTKTELSNDFINAVDMFSQRSKNVLNASDLSFDYFDSIEGDRGEKIGRNFYCVRAETSEISAVYNHYSCFFRVNLNSADLSSITGKKINYFSENTDKKLVDKANNLIQKMVTDYSPFFNNTDFEYFPFSYEANDGITQIKYGVSYDNIPLDTNYYGSIDHDTLNVNIGNNFSEIAIDENDNLLSVLSSYNWNVTENNILSNIISLEKACEIVDSNISDNVAFDVSRVDFVYKIPEVLDDDEQILSWNGVPSWKITIDATGIGEYQRLAFFVDAVTGEFSTYEIVM